MTDWWASGAEVKNWAERVLCCYMTSGTIRVISSFFSVLVLARCLKSEAISSLMVTKQLLKILKKNIGCLANLLFSRQSTWRSGDSHHQWEKKFSNAHIHTHNADDFVYGVVTGCEYHIGNHFNCSPQTSIVYYHKTENETKKCLILRLVFSAWRITEINNQCLLSHNQQVIHWVISAVLGTDALNGGFIR